MEPFVQSLHCRLEAEPQHMRMFETFVDRAMDEMQAAGYYSNLAPALQEKVDSEDYQESIDIKTSLAKEFAHHSFIRASNYIKMADDESARVIQVRIDPKFLNCLTLSIQGSLEGLFLTGAPKKNKSGKMYYFIENNATREDWDAFNSKMDALNFLYPDFHIIVLPGLVY